MAGEEAQRWKERVDQLTSSSRRLDPEEYRRLLTEKQTLAKQIDVLNRDLTEQKSVKYNIMKNIIMYYEI